MARKLEVGISEMLELRNQGYSNREIAEMLDISYPTVIRYIGKQNYRSANRPKPEEPQKEETKIKLISQTVAVNGFLFQINTSSKSIGIEFADGARTILSFEDLNKFKESLCLVSETLIG
jgi:predicted transcriptional regulator